MKLTLTKKKQCTVLTWPSRFLLSVFFILLILFIVFKLPLVLSKSEPIKAEYLVIDGLLPDYALEEARDIFIKGNYKAIIVTGGDLDIGYTLAEIKTMPGVSRAMLIALGIDSTEITHLHTGRVERNRTYTSGLKLKEWIEKEKIDSSGMNILTVGCHARRSKYLFSKALGNDCKIGVIGIEDRSYDIKHWWRSSKGTRTYLTEGIGLIYAILFF